MVQPTRDGFKALAAIVCGIIALLFGAVTLTAPMIATTGPAILTLGFAAAAVLLWRSSAVRPSPEQVAYEEQLRRSRVTPENPAGIWPPPPR
jgi:threonine/homoserine/homoserine lactone efflux protein